MPDDEQWAADRTTILQALGVLDPEGNPTARLDVVKAADVSMRIRTTLSGTVGAKCSAI
jgi:hypothetical protein